MGTVFMILSVLSGLYGLATLASASNIFHQIASLILFLIMSIFVSTSAVLFQMEKIRKSKTP